MLLEVKQKVSKVNWKAALIITTFIVGLIAYERTLGLIVVIGIPPLLIILACILPCIPPIAYLRRKWINEK